MTEPRPPRRPALRYHGGKWRLAPWIIEQFPAHRTYVEPFGGAASVLLRKDRSYCEIYNDLDGEVVNLFRVLRVPEQAAELCRLVTLTPYARSEFFLSYEPAGDPVEQARRTLVRSWMAHGSSGLRGHRTGFRLGSKREYTTPAMDWSNLPAALSLVTERLSAVFIECRPALQVIEAHDGLNTLFYVDPPYLFATRSQKRVNGDLYHGYRHELTDHEHLELIQSLEQLEGMVVLSGYPSDLYDDVLKGWRRISAHARADRGEPRTEVLWLNAAVCAAIDTARRAASPTLFGVEALS